MIICIDFDGTLVRQDRAFDDTETPLEFMPGARDALYALKRAGHTLVLWSSRTNRSRIDDYRLNPLFRDWDAKQVERWEKSKPVWRARLRQMYEFVEKNLDGVFDAIDDGQQGKFGADLYIDDRAMRLGGSRGGVDWGRIAVTYGDPDEGTDHHDDTTESRSTNTGASHQEANGRPNDRSAGPREVRVSADRKVLRLR